jgi:hypothetical protein
MRYWDSSALVSLLVQEPETAKREKQLRADAEIVTWWATRVECASALNRLARGGRLTQAQLKLALGDLDELAEGWAEVQPSDRVRLRAQRLLRVHPLRAADALQLSACLVAFDGESPGATFVCADERLGEAAEKEGLRVLP